MTELTQYRVQLQALLLKSPSFCVVLSEDKLQLNAHTPRCWTGRLSAMKHFLVFVYVHVNFKKLNSVAIVRKRTIPTEGPPLVGDVCANFAGRACCVVSVTNSQDR
jgi:hypothetical protein